MLTFKIKRSYRSRWLGLPLALLVGGIVGCGGSDSVDQSDLIGVDTVGDIVPVQFAASCNGASGIVLFNGNIHTMDPDGSVVSTVRIQDNIITHATNEDEEAVGRDADCKINLAGSTVIPGLIDNHVHITGRGEKPGHMAFNMDSARSWDDAVAVIGKKIVENNVPLPDVGTVGTQDNFITVIGAITAGQFAEGSLPDVATLNQFEHPVYLEAAIGSASVTNDAGKAYFESKGITVNADGSVVNTTGNPFFSNALGALGADQTEQDRINGAIDVLGWAASVGITTAQNMDPPDIAKQVFDAGNAIMRIRAQLHNARLPLSPEEFRDIIAANLAEPKDDLFSFYTVGEFIESPPFFFPTTADQVFTDATFLPKLSFAADLMATVHQHAFSPLEISTYLDAYEAQTSDITRVRWQLAHVNNMTTDSMDRLDALGGGAVPAFYSYTSANLVGQAFAPYKTLYEHDIHVGMGSDGGNVGVINPWLGIYHLTTGIDDTGAVIVDESERLTVAQSIELFTIGNAWFSFDEDKLGSIETGKLADLVVLTGAVFDTGIDLRDVKSALTLIDGKIVYSDNSIVACSNANSFGEWFPRSGTEVCG